MDLERALQAEVTPEAVLEAQLAPGEQVLWRGRPGTELLWPEPGTFHVQLLVLALSTVLCVLLFTGFRNPSLVTRGIAVALPLVSLYRLLAVPFVDARERRRTAYALTDRRILIVGGTPARRMIQSLPLKDITGIHLADSPDGRGTIHFGSSAGRHPQRDLRFVERPREVSGLIRQAQLAARFPETLGSSATQVSSAL